MRRLVLALSLVGAVAACSSSSPTPTPAPTPAPAPTPPTASGSSVDPWATTKPTTPADDAPSLVANHARAEKACPAVTAPYFYSIEKAGKKSVILGTRHIGVGLAKMPKVVKDRLMSAKLAVLETPPDDSRDNEPDRSGPSLAQQVGPVLWRHFVELVGKDAADAIEHQKPAIAVAGLAGIYEDISQTLDVEIEKVAAAHRIPIQGLETNDFQDKLLDKLLDLRMLKATIAGTKSRDELVHDSDDDLAKYCAGTDQDPGLEAKMKKQLHDAGYSDKEITDLDDIMLYARNRDWIPKLDKILANGDVFIAVGADHLRGPRGVIAALAAKGYTIARIAP